MSDLENRLRDALGSGADEAHEAGNVKVENAQPARNFDQFADLVAARAAGVRTN